MVHGRDRVLPDQRLFRNKRAEVADDRTHIAVRQLEPCASEGVGELVRMLVEAPGDLLVRRIKPQREVRGEHRGRTALRRIVRVRNRTRAGAPLRRPLIGAGRAFRQLPFVAEQVLEEVVAPFRRRRGPDDLYAAGDRVIAFAGAEFILPPEALLFDGRAFGFGADIDLGVGGAVRLAEGMAARDQRDGFLVVHRHALERFTDVPGRGDRIRLAVRPFRIDVDETHLHCAKGMFELAIAKIALVSQPLALWTPVDGIVGLPAVRASAAETEGLEAHRFEGDVAGENQKIRP